MQSPIHLSSQRLMLHALVALVLGIVVLLAILTFIGHKLNLRDADKRAGRTYAQRRKLMRTTAKAARLPHTGLGNRLSGRGRDAELRRIRIAL